MLVGHVLQGLPWGRRKQHLSCNFAVSNLFIAPASAIQVGLADRLTEASLAFVCPGHRAPKPQTHAALDPAVSTGQYKMLASCELTLRQLVPY